MHMLYPSSEISYFMVCIIRSNCVDRKFFRLRTAIQIQKGGGGQNLGRRSEEDFFVCGRNSSFGMLN